MKIPQTRINANMTRGKPLETSSTPPQKVKRAEANGDESEPTSSATLARTLAGGKLARHVRAARVALRGEALGVRLPARATGRDNMVCILGR